MHGRQVHGQVWATNLARLEDLLRNHAAGIASIDLFVVRTISFQLLYGLVILQHARRKLGESQRDFQSYRRVDRGQVTEAFPWDEAPRYLIRGKSARRRDSRSTFCSSRSQDLSSG